MASSKSMAAGACTLNEVFAPLPRPERGRPCSGAFKSSGGVLAYPSGNNVLLRELDDGSDGGGKMRVLAVFDGHGYAVSACSVSPSGRFCCSGDITGKVIVWAVLPGDDGAHHTVYEGDVLSGAVRDIVWSPDSTKICIAGDGKSDTFCKCIMWDSGNTLGSFAGIAKNLAAVDFRPARPFCVAAGGEDAKLACFKGPPFKFTGSVDLHTNFVNCVRFSPDGEYCVTCSSDKSVGIFSGRPGAESNIFDLLTHVEKAHEGSIMGISFVGARAFVTVSADKTVKLWRIKAKEEEGGGVDVVTESTMRPSDNAAGIHAMQMGCATLPRADGAPEGGDAAFMTVSLSGYINTFSSAGESAAPVSVLRGHTKAVKVLAWDAPRKTLYSGDVDGRLCAWRAGVGNIGVVAGPQHPEGMIHLTISGAEEGHLISSGLDNVLRSRSLPATLDDGTTEPDAPGAVGSELAKLTLNPQALASCPATGIVASVTTKEIVVVVPGGGERVLETTFRPTCVSIGRAAADGSTVDVAVGGADNKIHVYKFEVSALTLTETASLDKHQACVTCVSFSPDGTKLASGDANRIASVFNADDGYEVVMGSMVFHNSRINCVAWSPDSVRLATVSVDQSIIIWDSTKSARKRVAIANAHRTGAEAVVWMSDTRIASGGNDGFVRIFDIPFAS